MVHILELSFNISCCVTTLGHFIEHRHSMTLVFHDLNMHGSIYPQMLMIRY